MKRKMLDMGLGLILATEGHEIRICDLDAELENELISVVEKHLEFLKATNNFMKVYLKID